MAKKELTYYGKTLEELQKLTLNEFADLTPSRIRRSLKRGFNDKNQILLQKIKNNEDNIKTHCRDMIVIPEMLGKTLLVYNGKTFVKIIITVEMLGRYLGEYALTRKSVSHSAPGIGATRSSSAMSVK